uniref:IL-2 n=1 Tax=Rhabditophanes sp. KR3021 TaxID=114890 RepID=A0AC35U7N5_9BILA
MKCSLQVVICFLFLLSLIQIGSANHDKNLLHAMLDKLKHKMELLNSDVKMMKVKKEIKALPVNPRSPAHLLNSVVKAPLGPGAARSL